MSRSAILVAGFSESHEFVESFANEVTTGPHALADDIDVILLGDALAQPERHNKAFAERLVITHSAGILAVNRALEIIALNAPEPNPLRKTIAGAIRVTTDRSPEPDVVLHGMMDPVREVLKHPAANVGIPFKLRRFSSVSKLIRGKRAFPEGRSLFYTDQDEFGYTRPNIIEIANKYGLFARIVNGKHNEALLRPHAMLAQIHTAFQER